jgi:GWxTD domain-containing protein
MNRISCPKLLKLLVVAALSLTSAEGATGDLSFFADAYHFRGVGGPEVEIAIRIPATQLKFQKDGDRWVAAYRPTLQLLDEKGNEVRKIGGDRLAGLGSLEKTTDPGTSINDVARFNVDPGTYEGVLEISTPEGLVSTVRMPIDVPAYKRGELGLSSIQIVREVDPWRGVEDSERFRKAGHIVLPAPSRIVDRGEPLRWYVELYEIGRLEHEVRFELVDAYGHKVLSDVREFEPYRDDARFLEGASLRHLPTGDYTLEVTVEAGPTRVSETCPVEIVGQASTVSQHFDANQQAHMRALMVSLGADPAVLQAYDALDTPGRARYAYGYWRENDPMLASTYAGPLTGLGRHEVRLPLLRALKHERTLKKRVDKAFGERLPQPDTLAIRHTRELVKVILDADKEDPFALTADALLALEAGYLAEGEFFAKNALKAIPDLADAKNAIGLSKIGRSDWDDAIEWFESAAGNDPDWGTPMLNADLARFMSGDGNAMHELATIRKAVYHDLTHPDAYYIAGRLLERHGRLDESKAAYIRQISVNPQHARARFDLGRVYFKQGHIDTAAIVWHELLEARPDVRTICIAPLLDAYIRIGETGKAQALIADEIRTLDETARSRVEDISMVAGPKEVIAYQSLPEEERARYVRAFWQKRDPTPATPGNERLVEHYRRVVYALNNFPSVKKGWDRRGDVYIRYGEPAHISRHDDVRYEMDREVVRVRERLQRSLSSEAREEIIARAGRYRTSTRDKLIVGEYGQQVELQDFESIDFEMNPNRSLFIGEQDNANGYVRGTEEATQRGKMREKPIHGIPLFPIDGGTTWEYWIYPDVAGGIEVVFTALTPKGELDYPDLPRGRELARFNEKVWEERRAESVITRAKSQQPDRYLPPGEVLEFHFATADFRGPNDRTRLEVYYGVPVLSLAAAEEGGPASSDDDRLFERGVALFDSTWTPIYRNTTQMTFEVDDDETQAGTLAIDEVALQLPAGRYFLGVQVNHPSSKRRNGYTQELIIDDYTGEGLHLSDIEIAGRVDPDERATLKGGLQVTPMPSRTFNPGQPVLIYYEVYGLARDAFGQSIHRVDYRIKPRKGKLSAVRVIRALGRLLGIEEKAIVTISYERTGTEQDEQTYLEIDPGESKEGVYELTVTVTDMVSEQTTEKITTFLIGE